MDYDTREEREIDFPRDEKWERPRLTEEQRAEVQSLVDDGGYTRLEAIALVLAQVVCP